MLQEPLINRVKEQAAPMAPGGRFLSETHYREAITGFRKYDGGTWRATMKLDITATFLVVPVVALTGWTLFLYVISRVLPSTLAVMSLGPQVHVVLGGALSFIVVFRTNTAYSRWWEARMLWGAVNNNIRSVVCRATTMLKSDAAYTQMVTEFMAYAVLLKNHLRGVKTTPDELGGMLPFALIATLCESANPPLAAVQALAVTVRNGIKTDAGPDALLANASFLSIQTALDALAGTVGACERVKNTPTPYGYVSALRSFMLIWLFSMPFTLIGMYNLLAVPVSAAHTPARARTHARARTREAAARARSPCCRLSPLSASPVLCLPSSLTMRALPCSCLAPPHRPWPSSASSSSTSR